jgi:YidC/Oxa1 family membrane protein insertase
MDRDTVKFLLVMILVMVGFFYFQSTKHNNWIEETTEWAKKNPEAFEKWANQEPPPKFAEAIRRNAGLPASPDETTPLVSTNTPIPGVTPDGVTPTTPNGQDPRAVVNATRNASLADIFNAPPLGGAEKQITVESDKFRMVFSSRGGRLVSLRLKDYDEIYPKKKFLEIHKDKSRGAAKAHIADLLELREQQENGYTKQAVELVAPFLPAELQPLGLSFPNGVSDANLVYQLSSNDLVVDETSSLVMTAKMPGATLIKKLTFFPGSYEMELSIHLELSPGVTAPDEPLSLDWNGGIGRIFPQEKLIDYRGVYNLDGSSEQKDVKGLDKHAVNNGGSFPVDGEIGWIGVDSKYFLAAFIPLDLLKQASFSVLHPVVQKGTPRAGMHLNLPLEMLTQQHSDSPLLRMYFGPKELHQLQLVGSDIDDTLYGIGFYGKVTGPICIIMLSILNWLNAICHNYGISILLLTILAKLVMFPLMHKQTKSMKRMQKLQPMIKEIQARNKDNPRQAQKEQFELMRKYKANPMSGCLPMLATMPIFIALWITTQKTIALRGEPFLWWITDLSRPDTLFYLPFEIPAFGGLFDFNLLPLVSGVLMYLQMAKTSTDPKQKPMLIMMPIMMLLIFWRMPSGTNLYLMMSSLFQMAQQWIVNRTDNDEELVPIASAVAKSGSVGQQRPERPKNKRPGPKRRNKGHK